MSPTSPPKAIVFDLLTALLDSWTAWDRAASTALQASSQADANTEVTPGAGRAWRAEYLTLTYATGAYVPYPELVHESASRAGLPPSAPAALLSNWDAWLTPWPEAARALTSLRAAGLKLAVVTNCSADLGARAAALVSVPFDAVVTAEESGWYKPDARAYAGVLEKLGVGAHEALFVAGSAADVPGARGAGMRVVWHNRVGLPPLKTGAGAGAEAEREGRTLDEALEGVLAEVLGAREERE